MAIHRFILRPTTLAVKSFLLPSHRITTHRVQFHSTIQAAMQDRTVASLGPQLQAFIREKQELCQPEDIHICDGSPEENEFMINKMIESKMMKRLPLYEECYIVRTDPADVARVESKTFICTERREDTIPTPADGVEGKLGKWESPEKMKNALFNDRFPGCMRGRTMYVIPFCMGPLGSPLAKIGVQLTDSPYVVSSMRIMTRMGAEVMKRLDDDNFVKCLHSVGQPLPAPDTGYAWPCNPDKTVITHFPATREIVSFGSGYGGNSLLGKKCLALRLGSVMARDEGWFAEHMLIMGITNPEGKKRYIAAAFPSACGKTNLAMLNPTLPGWKAECVGDDIAWMKFDENGVLRAINPEFGFFGVAPGTNMSSNPNAMTTVTKNTVFTNVAERSDGGFFWEGLEKEIPPNVTITDWLGNENWNKDSGKPAAHPNSRFCAPIGQCPVMDPAWEDPAGVPISALIFGGRRPEGIPLVYEAFNWQHGVFIASSMRSEATAAAEHKGKVIMHDPFAMRPFFGYNFSNYMKHWLSFQDKPNVQLPKIFHVNWFRKGKNDGKFLWPGFGENTRVLDWIFRRCDGEEGIARHSPIGLLPSNNALNLEGLGKIEMKELMSVPKDYWLNEVEAIRKYLDDQLSSDVPSAIKQELDDLEERVKQS
mgnify:CR=1 FL=1